MKILIKQSKYILVGFVLGAWVLSATAQRTFQGRYEIQITWGSSSSRVVSAYQVTAGETIEVPIGTDIVSISVSPLTADDYDLRVSVAPKRAAAGLRPLAARSRNGRFGESLDLHDPENSISLPSETVVAVRKLWE